MQHTLRGFVEINQDVRFVLTFGEPLHNSGFSYTPCTLYEQCTFAIIFLLPLKKLPVDFPLKNIVHNGLLAKNLEKIVKIKEKCK